MSTTTTHTGIPHSSPEGSHGPDSQHGPIWKVVAGGTAIFAAAGVYLGTRGDSGTENTSSGTTVGIPANPGHEVQPPSDHSTELPDNPEYNRGNMLFPGLEGPVGFVDFKSQLAITGVKRYPDHILTMIETTNEAGDRLNRLLAAGLSAKYLNPGISSEDMRKYHGLIDEAMEKALFAPNQSGSELALFLRNWVGNNNKLQNAGLEPDMDANLIGADAKGYSTVMLNGGETFELKSYIFSLANNPSGGKPVVTNWIADMVYDPNTGGFVFGPNKQIPNSDAS